MMRLLGNKYGKNLFDLRISKQLKIINEYIYYSISKYNFINMEKYFIAISVIRIELIVLSKLY